MPSMTKGAAAADEPGDPAKALDIRHNNVGSSRLGMGVPRDADLYPRASPNSWDGKFKKRLIFRDLREYRRGQPWIVQGFGPSAAVGVTGWLCGRITPQPMRK